MNVFSNQTLDIPEGIPPELKQKFLRDVAQANRNAAPLLYSEPIVQAYPGEYPYPIMEGWPEGPFPGEVDTNALRKAELDDKERVVQKEYAKLHEKMNQLKQFEQQLMELYQQ